MDIYVLVCTSLHRCWWLAHLCSWGFIAFDVNIFAESNIFHARNIYESTVCVRVFVFVNIIKTTKIKKTFMKTLPPNWPYFVFIALNATVAAIFLSTLLMGLPSQYILLYMFLIILVDVHMYMWGDEVFFPADSRWNIKLKRKDNRSCALGNGSRSSLADYWVVSSVTLWQRLHGWWLNDRLKIAFHT